MLAAGDFYAHTRRQPAHLLQIAGNVPETLILSRTRDHGIDLGPIGLSGLVLDPRAGIHATVLAAAAAQRIPRVVMTTTANAAANVAAYGRHFRQHHGTRLLYALHGRLPYEYLVDLNPAYAACRLRDTARALFETWFLPLAGLKDKNGVPAGALPALLKHFHRARGLPPPAETTLAGLRERVRAGDADWVMDKAALAAAMTTTADHPAAS